MSRIKFIFLDIDGTLTDGKIYYTASGEEMKSFNIKDGLVVAAFVRLGFQIVVMTGRKSAIVEKRMSELGVVEIFQGIRNKKQCLEEYIQKHNINTKEIAYVGDDLNDLVAMQICKFKACPADACAEIKNCVDYVSSYEAGKGAIRDIFELIAKEQGVWENIVKSYEW